MASVEETSDVQPVNFERSSTLLFTNTPGVQFLYLGRSVAFASQIVQQPFQSLWTADGLAKTWVRRRNCQQSIVKPTITLTSKHIR